MGKKSLISIFIFIICCWETHAQRLDLTNSKPLDQDRYEGVRGSPYFFEDWKKAKVLADDLEFIEGVLVNYNGLTQEFEASDGTNYIQLDERTHKRIEVWDEVRNTSVVFINASTYDISSTYAQMFYSGISIMWLGTFKVKIDERKLETPGKTELIRQFNIKKFNYFVFEEKPIEFRMKKKKILEALSGFPEAPRIVKEKKLNIEEEEGLIKLLTELESISTN
jgi:hypothetical protein